MEEVVVGLDPDSAQVGCNEEPASISPVKFELWAERLRDGFVR
jgi:hypothetical protein